MIFRRKSLGKKYRVRPLIGRIYPWPGFCGYFRTQLIFLVNMDYDFLESKKNFGKNRCRQQCTQDITLFLINEIWVEIVFNQSHLTNQKWRWCNRSWVIFWISKIFGNSKNCRHLAKSVEVIYRTCKHPFFFWRWSNLVASLVYK